MESPELRRSKRRRTSTKHSDEVVSTNIGKTIHWKGIEKERLLEALKRSANLENYKHIARSVKTKSVEEVKAYMELMKRKARMAAVTNEDSIITPIPLQKWLTLSKELAGLTPLDYSVEIGNVLTLAHLEGEKPAQTDTLLENSSLPLPDYSKIYMYLSDMMAGREVSPSSLSLTEAWVLNDLLQSLESEINQADTKEQEAFMQQRYQWLMCKLYAGDADIELDPSVAKEHTGILVPLSSISRIRNNNNGQSGTGAILKATATATSAQAPPSHTASAPSAAANKQSAATLTSTEQVVGTAAASCPEEVTPASMVATSSSAASNSVVDADSTVEKGTSSGTSAVASASASHSSASEPAMPVDMGASLTTLNVTPPDVAQPSTEGVVQKQNAMGLDAYNKDTNNVHVNTDINGSKGSQLPVAATTNSLPPLSTTTNAARQSESKSSPSAGVSGERLQHSVTAQAVPDNAVTNSASAQTATEIIASAGPTTATMTTAMSAQQTSSTTTTRSAASAEEATTRTATAASDNTAANDNKKKKRLVVPKSGIATLNPFSVPIKLLNIIQPPSTNTNNDC